MNNIITTGSTYRTSDYSLFSRLEGNRPILASRVQKILLSIKNDGYIFNPIVVNEKYQIIDGQGRFEALRTMGMPIDYVVAPGTGIAECITLNAYTTKWTILDFVSSYGEHSNINYLRLLSVINNFPDLRTQLKIMITLGRASIPSEAIKRGKIIVTEEMQQDAENTLLFLSRFTSAFRRIRGRTEFYYFALAFARRCGADEDRLLKCFERAELSPANTQRQALDAVSDLYNLNLKDQRKRIYLYPLYEEQMIEKYGWYQEKWAGHETADGSDTSQP